MLPILASVKAFVVVVFLSSAGNLPVQYSIEADTCVAAQSKVEALLDGTGMAPVVMFCTDNIGSIDSLKDVRTLIPTAPQPDLEEAKREFNDAVSEEQAWAAYEATEGNEL